MKPLTIASFRWARFTLFLTNEGSSMKSSLILLATSLIASPIFADDAANAFRDRFVNSEMNWEDVTTRAREEANVNLYYWGGDELLNIWMETKVSDAMKAEGITLNPVRITSTKDAVDLILAEKASGKGLGDGTVDALWVNGENFNTLKTQDALFGSFADKLPNSKNFSWDEDDKRALLNLRDFGVETLTQEMPWSGEQYVCSVNRARVSAEETPHNFDELRTYLEANPGKFTYVKPPHYIGNTFVQEVIYALNPDGTGAASFQASRDELGAAEIARLIEPGMTYLRDIQPLLLGGSENGANYPEDIPGLETAFLNSEIDFACKFGIYGTTIALETGAYPAEAEAFIFPEGHMIKNKNYLAIPSNAPHPAAALVLMNYMSSFEAQAGKLVDVGMPAGLDPWMLSDEERNTLEEAAPALIGVTQDELDANIAPDTNATLVDVIEAVWLAYIERGEDKPIEALVEEALEGLSNS